MLLKCGIFYEIKFWSTENIFLTSLCSSWFVAFLEYSRKFNHLINWSLETNNSDNHTNLKKSRRCELFQFFDVNNENKCYNAFDEIIFFKFETVSNVFWKRKIDICFIVSSIQKMLISLIIWYQITLMFWRSTVKTFVTIF